MSCIVEGTKRDRSVSGRPVYVCGCNDILGIYMAGMRHHKCDGWRERPEIETDHSNTERDNFKGVRGRETEKERQREKEREWERWRKDIVGRKKQRPCVKRTWCDFEKYNVYYIMSSLAVYLIVILLSREHPNRGKTVQRFRHTVAIINGDLSSYR